MRPYLGKKNAKQGLVEWLKVEALSSSPSTAKKKKKANMNHGRTWIVVTSSLIMD
jgi:hypothetical protein